MSLIICVQVQLSLDFTVKPKFPSTFFMLCLSASVPFLSSIPLTKSLKISSMYIFSFLSEAVCNQFSETVSYLTHLKTINLRSHYCRFLSNPFWLCNPLCLCRLKSREFGFSNDRNCYSFKAHLLLMMRARPRFLWFISYVSESRSSGLALNFCFSSVSSGPVVDFMSGGSTEPLLPMHAKYLNKLQD